MANCLRIYLEDFLFNIFFQFICITFKLLQLALMNYYFITPVISAGATRFSQLLLRRAKTYFGGDSFFYLCDCKSICWGQTIRALSVNDTRFEWVIGVKYHRLASFLIFFSEFFARYNFFFLENVSGKFIRAKII